jgi:NADH:ubiquinone oxidoreductase subunit 5 (subunit L)/multisubunit Na+/H+ antiporter MnhA subunit
LLFLGSQIPLPHYFVLQITHPVVENIPGVLQNDSFVWRLMVLLVLMVLFAVAGLWPNQRLSKGMAWGVIIGVGLTLLFSLCNLASNLAAGFDTMDARANTLSGVVHGSLLTIGLLGLWLGMIIAFIGSVITLRSRD